MSPSNMILMEFFFSLQIRTIVKPGCSQEVLKSALSIMASVTEVLTTMSSSASGNNL